MIGATATPVKLPDDGVYVAQPAYAQPVYAEAVQARPVSAPAYPAQPMGAPYVPQGYHYGGAQQYQQQGYIGARPMSYAVQQPVAPVYVAGGRGQHVGGQPYYQGNMSRMDAEMHARQVQGQIQYEQRRKDQEREEACCIFALGAVCCAALLAAD